MNTDKMYNLDQFCCTCMNKSGLKHLFEVDSDGVSHYDKLTSSIAEMNFKEMNDQRLICGECCITLNTVYDFRQMCLRSKENLMTHITQLRTSDHTSGTLRVCLKDIKPELIVVKNRGGNENEDSNCFEGNNPQIKFQTQSYKENIDFSASIKEECQSEDDDSFAHEDAIVDHLNEGAHSDVKVEDVQHLTMMEEYSEYYMEFNKIEIEEDPLAEVKEEPMSDTETPQDGSISQADTGTSEEPKISAETTIGTELTQSTEKENDELHKCGICHKNFNSKDSHMQHMQTHSSERPYECEVCKKGFKYKKNVTKHMKLHSSERPYECEICKKDFYIKWDLTAHMKIHASKKPYKCEICKQDFFQKNSLTKHLKTHSTEKPYKCEICKKGFHRMFSRTVHMKIHSSERPYECEICKKRFNCNWNLTDHMKTHSSERPYECEICKKRFNRKYSCIEHMSTHSSERPYECEICKKRFNRKGNLTVHMKTHSSERPYECEICKKGYNHKSSLTEHMKTH